MSNSSGSISCSPEIRRPDQVSLDPESGCSSPFVSFIMNPISGAGKALKVWDAVIENRVNAALPKDRWKLMKTSRPGDAVSLAQQACQQGSDVIVSIGGDGTHSEVVNGIMRFASRKVGGDQNLFGVPSKSLPIYAIIPIGTGGDLRRSLVDHEKKEPELIDFLELILNPERGEVIEIDVGRVHCVKNSKSQTIEVVADDEDMGSEAVAEEGESSILNSGVREGLKPLFLGDINLEEMTVLRYFVNISSCGISGEVCSAVNNSSKALGGFLTFLVHTCYQSMIWKNKPVRWRVKEDEEWRSANLFQLVVGNAKYFGGGMKVAPEALIDDGKLDIVCFRDIGVLDAAILLQTYRGQHTGFKKVCHVRSSSVFVDPKKEQTALRSDSPSGGEDGRRESSSRSPTKDGGKKMSVEEAGEEDSESPGLVEADGELIGRLPALWEVLPRALRMIVPASFASSLLAREEIGDDRTVEGGMREPEADRGYISDPISL